MKIVIMGTGAMACLFGARMSEQGNEVWLISGWKEHVSQIVQNGLTVQEKDKPSFTVYPRAGLNAAEVLAGDAAYPELVLISSKGYQTDAAVQKALNIIGPDTCVLTLQNGIGNADIIAQYVPEDRVFWGSASVAADLLELGVVKDATNRNRSPLISIMPYNKSADERTIHIGNLFQSLGYDTKASCDAELNIWKKLTINACANAVASISQLPNYIYSNDPDGLILLKQICAEVCAVAQAKGIKADCDEFSAYVYKTLHNQNHYVSMCQDVHNKRQTEIESINGAIVKEGQKLGVPTPINETLLHLVKIISNHYDERWN